MVRILTNVVLDAISVGDFNLTILTILNLCAESLLIRSSYFLVRATDARKALNTRWSFSADGVIGDRLPVHTITIYTVLYLVFRTYMNGSIVKSCCTRRIFLNYCSKNRACAILFRKRETYYFVACRSGRKKA